MTADEIYFVNGGSGFSWGGFWVAIGAVVGALLGVAKEGIGADWGAIAGGRGGGITYCEKSMALNFGIWYEVSWFY